MLVQSSDFEQVAHNTVALHYQGRETKRLIFDYADAKRLEGYRLFRNGEKDYCVLSKGKRITVQKFLLGLPIGTNQYSKQVLFKNGNRLDFRRENLEVVTKGTLLHITMLNSSTKNINDYKKQYTLPKHITISQYKTNPDLVYVESSITLAGTRFRSRVCVRIDSPTFEQDMNTKIERGLKFVDRIKANYIPIFSQTHK